LERNKRTDPEAALAQYEQSIEDDQRAFRHYQNFCQIQGSYQVDNPLYRRMDKVRLVLLERTTIANRYRRECRAGLIALMQPPAEEQE
jgi:hypothetical protein